MKSYEPNPVRRRKVPKEVPAEIQAQWSPEERERRDIERRVRVPLADTDLSVRTVNVLEAAGVITIADLIVMSGDQLSSVEALGDTAFLEVKRVINRLGIYPRKWEPKRKSRKKPAAPRKRSRKKASAAKSAGAPGERASGSGSEAKSKRVRKPRPSRAGKRLPAPGEAGVAPSVEQETTAERAAGPVDTETPEARATDPVEQETQAPRAPSRVEPRTGRTGEPGAPSSSLLPPERAGERGQPGRSGPEAEPEGRKDRPG